MIDRRQPETLRFVYRPKPLVMALAGLLFAGFAVFLVQQALTNDEGLIIDRVIELSPSAATGFYWLLAAACVLLVGGALLGLVRAFGPPREMVLGAEGLTAPRNALRHEPVTVPYAAITDLRMTAVRQQRFVTIHHPGGRLSIARGMFPAAADFDRFVAELDARVGAARGRG